MQLKSIAVLLVFASLQACTNSPPLVVPNYSAAQRLVAVEPGIYRYGLLYYKGPVSNGLPHGRGACWLAESGLSGKPQECEFELGALVNGQRTTAIAPDMQRLVQLEEQRSQAERDRHLDGVYEKRRELRKEQERSDKFWSDMTAAIAGGLVAANAEQVREQQAKQQALVRAAANASPSTPGNPTTASGTSTPTRASSSVPETRRNSSSSSGLSVDRPSTASVSDSARRTQEEADRTKQEEARKREAAERERTRQEQERAKQAAESARLEEEQRRQRANAEAQRTARAEAERDAYSRRSRADAYFRDLRRGISLKAVRCGGETGVIGTRPSISPPDSMSSCVTIHFETRCPMSYGYGESGRIWNFVGQGSCLAGDFKKLQEPLACSLDTVEVNVTKVVACD